MMTTREGTADAVVVHSVAAAVSEQVREFS